MKRFFFIFAVTLTFYFQLFAFNCFAQTPEWVWAKSAGGNSADASRSIATDADNNIIETGGFTSDTITFGSIKVSNTNPGTQDIFIAKYDPQGNVLWAKSAGGINNDYSMHVATDTRKDIIITGYFDGPYITFDTVTLFNSGPEDIFIAKYDAYGKLLWAESVGGNKVDHANGIATDADNNILITGEFDSDTLAFGTDTLFNGDSIPSWNIFITKYNSSGNELWAKSKHDGFASSIAIDANNNIELLGTFGSKIIFGTDTLTNFDLGSDIFVAKFDSSGNALWARSAIGTVSPFTLPNLEDYGESITTDASGNIIITGRFESYTIRFGVITLVNKADLGAIYPGSSDIFIAKYNASGNIIWVKGAGTSDWDSGMGVTTDSANNVYVTGYYSLYALTFGIDSLPITGCQNIFLVKFDSLGNIIWDKYAGNGGNCNWAYGIASDKNNNIIITGSFGVSIVFGSDTLSESDLWGEAFLAKLGTITSINEIDNTYENIYIFPNPANDIITIENSFFSNDQTIYVYNIQGQLLIQQPLHQIKYDIDISGFAKGMYFIRVSSGDGIAVKKFVKE
jgi:hypothetical protein